MNPSQASSTQEQAVIRKVALRLIPFLCLLYFVAFLDRVNVDFAALTMNADIGLTASATGKSVSTRRYAKRSAARASGCSPACISA